MSKELKIGIISLVALLTMIWGYQYLKGKNILKKINSFEVVYDNVEGLDVAAPVEINGYGVGSVSSIELNPEDVRSMVVKFEIQGEFKFPKSARAILATDNGLTGTKKIIIDFDELCTDGNCLASGDRMSGSSRGMLQTLFGEDEMKDYFTNLRMEVGPIMDSVMLKIASKDADNAVSNSLQNLEKSLGHLASLTLSMDRLMKTSSNNLNKTIDNMAVVTGTFAKTHAEMENIIKSFSSVATELSKANLGETLSKTGETFDNTNELLRELKITAEKANASFATVNELLAKVESGDGSIAKLLNDPEIYNNLEATTKHMSLLLQDMRLNPKRYVRLSVFGRKGDPYSNPNADPALDTLDQEKKN